MPLLGLKYLIGLGAALDIALGIVLLSRSQERRVPSSALRGALVGLAAIALVVTGVDLEPKRLASGVYRYGRADRGDARVLYYKDGKTASVSLFAYGSQITLATNGKPDASIQMDPAQPSATDEITMVMAATLPLAYNPAAREIANIGLGSGLTTHTLLAHDRLDRVDTIEIEAAMIEAAQGFGERVERTYSDPRSVIHLEDAKTFFSLQNHKYDAIVAEPSNPWVSGVASLFSDEFYRTVPNYLNEDGILVQWLQLYEFNDDLVLSVLRALSRNFSDYVIYNTDDINILIVAKPFGTLGEPSFETVLSGALGVETARVGLHAAEDFLVRKTGTAEMLKPWLAQSAVPVNSDYFPFLDLNAGKARFQQQVATLFVEWSVASLPALEMVGVSTFDLGKVTPDPTFERTMSIALARSIQTVLAGGDEATLGSAAKSVGPTITALELLSRFCESPAAEEAWLLGLESLAHSTLARLDADAATALLDAVLPLRCRTQRSALALVWFALYRAVAARDALRMAAAAESVLEFDRTSEPARRRYALTAAMLGHYSSGRPDKALELWENRTATVGAFETTPELELVLTLARGAQARHPGTP
jgi:spermidine synthase